MPIRVVFVDPFSSTFFLAESLKQAGIEIICVYTLSSTIDYIKLRPEIFDQCYYLEHFQDIKQLIDIMRDLNVNRVYSGSEFSVAIADALANALCPRYANSITTSTYRSDKYAMQEALLKAGLSSVRQMKLTETLSSQQTSELTSWNCPMIIKPINSAAAKGVMYCNNVAKIQKYLQAYKNDLNILGQKIPYFIVQECLQGEEYFIDTYSEDSRHYFGGMQRYERKMFRNRPICFYTEVIFQKDKQAIVCEEYVKQCLSALGLNNGFAHTEIMLTDKGPYLIEVNPRISGASGLNNKLFRACAIPSQVDLLIASCHDGLNTIINSHQMPLYGRKVFLHSYRKRLMKNLNLDLLSTLPSFSEALALKQAGDLISQPKNLTDSVAILLLVHANKNQLKEDYAKIRAWERDQRVF